MINRPIHSDGWAGLKSNCFTLGASLNAILQLEVLRIIACSSVCFSNSLSVYKTLTPKEATKTVFLFWGKNLNILKSVRKTNKYTVIANSLAIVHIQVFFDF